MWQSSRPASFSPAGLTLWLSWLERWLATLSGAISPGSNTSGVAGTLHSSMAPDTPVWQPAILTRPERNMTISRLWVNYQCAELNPGLWTSPECNVPATPLVFEPGLIAHSESRASALTNLAKGSDPLARSCSPAGLSHNNNDDDNCLFPFLRQSRFDVHVKCVDCINFRLCTKWRNDYSGRKILTNLS